MEENTILTSQEVMEHIVRALDSKKARDITVLKTDKVSVLAEYFVICTAGSPAQIKSLSDETGKRLSELDEAPRRVEGYRAGGWVLMDYHTVIVHVFTRDARQFYNLDKLWSEAEEVDIAPLLIE